MRYFYHERALPMGLYVFFLYVGALLGPMLSGYIYEGSQTWQAPIVRTLSAWYLIRVQRI
jgi:MFS family permease